MARRGRRQGQEVATTLISDVGCNRSTPDPSELRGTRNPSRLGQLVYEGDGGPDICVTYSNHSRDEFDTSGGSMCMNNHRDYLFG